MNTIDRASPQKLKIAVVVPKYGLVGGGERFASEVTERLARNDYFDIHVFARSWVAESNRITFHRVPTIRFPRFLRQISFAWFSQLMIRRGGFNLVHSHDRIFHADIFSVHSVPHAGWIRDVRKKRPSLFDRAMITIERRMMATGGSSYFLPVSSIGLEAFSLEYGSLPGHWEIVHPGVNVRQFSTPNRNACRAEIRKRYGIGASDFLILFVGMNFEVKGLDTIIAALAKARTTRPEAAIRLLVVGRGNESKYRAIARSHGVAEAVTFAGIQTEGIEKYFRAADAFALLSSFDTFGMVVLEAMAAELPVIVSPNVGAKDLVEDSINGFVLPDCRDADAATERIVRLLDADRRKAVGMAALHTATEHDWVRLAEKIEHIYKLKNHTKDVI